MRDFTLDELLPFCSPERSRSYLSLPFVIGDGGFTYASNGHIAIRVPGRLTDVDQMKNVPSIVGMFESVEGRDYRPFEVVTAEAAKLNRCTVCEGRRYVTDCQTCEGTGMHECSDDACRCEHDCGACSGRGVYPALASDHNAYFCDECFGTGREIDKRNVDLGAGLAVQWRYLQKVQQLPGPISWGVPPAEPDKYHPDRWTYGAVSFMGPGWLALILPIRTYGTEQIRAIRHGAEAVA